MDFKKLKEIKNFFILIVPEGRGTGAKQHKVSSFRLLVIMFTYSVLVAFLGFLFLNITPVKNWIFPSTGLSSKQVKQINDLNERVIFLAKEMESLKSTNERLRYAMHLGDSLLIDSLIKSADTSSGLNTGNKTGGSIISIFRMLIKKNIPQDLIQDSQYYLIRPVTGYISRDFNTDKGHFGMDFVVKTGTPVVSAANGYVVFSGYTIKDGYMIMIAHPDDLVTIYKHCSLLLKKERDRVLQGELIALSGNTGEITTGPHLHFEVWKDGRPVDPKKFFIN